MIEEVNNALKFLARMMTHRRIPRQTIQEFIETLTTVLHEHYNNHWFPETPDRGSGYRCLRNVRNKMDPLFAKAGRICGLTVNTLLQILPAEFTMWIDPAEVSYRIGEEGSIGLVYRARTQESDGDSIDSLSGDESICSDGTTDTDTTVSTTSPRKGSSLYGQHASHHFKQFDVVHLTTAVMS